jgi:y4mF family transcriptional regulator
MITMIQSTENIGQLVRKVRKALSVTQSDLALSAGTGLRFIIELEKGKSSCQIGKVLQVLQVLGIKLQLSHEMIEEDNHEK